MLTEIVKLRAARELWAELMRDYSATESQIYHVTYPLPNLGWL